MATDTSNIVKKNIHNNNNIVQMSPDQQPQHVQQKKETAESTI